MSLLELALVGQVLIWLMVIGVFLASGQASIFHPLTIYLLFHGMVFVVRPILVHYFGFDTIWKYMMVSPSERDLLRTLGVTSVALVAFSVGSMWVGRTRLHFPTPEPVPFGTAQKQALIITTLLLSPIIAYSIRSLVGGGLQGEHHGGTFVLTGASGYTLEAQYMAGPLICAWMAVTRFSRMGLVPLMLYVGYRAYTGWNRWTIVLFFVALCAVYAWQKRIRWLPYWSLLLVIPLFLLFQTLGKNRNYFRTMFTGGSVEETSGPTSPEERFKLKYDTQEFANFDYLCFVVKAVPERTGTYTYGSQYLQLFTEPIPRKLWKSKPAGAPVGFFNLNNYGNFLGLTVSLPGDGWMSGGWVGLVVTMLAVGSILGLAHRWFWRHVQNNMAALVYLISMAMLPQWYRDGGISISKFLFWNLSPLVLWTGIAWLCGPRLVPGQSLILGRHTRVRLLEPGAKPGGPRVSGSP
jgi:hypothetical protein